MEFDYKNHYKRLVHNLAAVLIESMEGMPEEDKNTPPKTNSSENVEPIVYPPVKRKNHYIIEE